MSLSPCAAISDSLISVCPWTRRNHTEPNSVKTNLGHGGLKIRWHWFCACVCVLDPVDRSSFWDRDGLYGIDSLTRRRPYFTVYTVHVDIQSLSVLIFLSPRVCLSSLPSVQSGDGLGGKGHRAEVSQHGEPGGGFHAQKGPETQVPVWKKRQGKSHNLSRFDEYTGRLFFQFSFSVLLVKFEIKPQLVSRVLSLLKPIFPFTYHTVHLFVVR